MSRRTIAALAALAVVLVGVPVAIAVLGGDGDEPSRDRPVVSDRAPTDREIPGYNAPVAGGSSVREEEPAARKPAPKGKPGETYAKSFDATMTGVAYPAAITRAGEHAVRAVESVVGPEVSAGQQSVIAADCRAGVCSVRYRTGPRGTGHILGGLAEIVQRLFARRDVRGAVVYVHHEITRPGKEERPAFVVVTCRRSAHPRADWARLGAQDVRRYCRVVENAGGALRNELRRGLSSPAEASRGEHGDGASGTPGPLGPKRLRPAGTPAPRNVNDK
ncbi:MAG TPA: hypothetical protein VF529_05360 [Solirubrobacteraceae bacterium]|jgi:hypothetical protein